MLEFFTQLVGSLGYGDIVFLMMVLAPELVLPFAGYLVVQGKLGLVGVLAAGTLGALLGQLFFYGLARALGERRVRHFLARYGHFLFLKEADLDRVLRIFKRYDVSTLVFARFVPTLRTLVSVPAGFVGMSLLRFTTFTTLGTFLWNAVLVGAGLLLGRNWRAVLPFINVYGWVVLAVLVGGVAWLLWRRCRVAKLV